MLRNVKLAILRSLKASGLFGLVANSRWRRERLLILCYHGIALEDEHLWRPGLYMHPELLVQRLEILKLGGYAVLPLGEGLQRLESGTLPARSVTITFDDGTYDFYKAAHPVLKAYGFPVTVYQTTYYTDYQRPVFNLICSYLLWKRRGEVIQDGRELGLSAPLDLRDEVGRHKVVRALIDLAERENMTGRQKDEQARRLARFLGIDYQALTAKRILQLMNAREIREIVREGVDIQLHTHRHRTPDDEALFEREICDNKARLQEMVASTPVHFCYPSGLYKTQFLPWLAKQQVISATTCDSGLATRASKRLLLPRYVDNQLREEIEFESWLVGVGDLLAFRRAARQKYVPANVCESEQKMHSAVK
jgi:peptidoglycan/xylan/chitin deacetylase (PgdA/CDA1 family)